MRKVVALLLILFGIIFIINNLRDSGRLGGEPGHVNEAYTFQASSIHEISIDSNEVNIKLVEGSSQEEVNVRLSGDASRKYKLSAELSGDELEVSYKRKWSLFSLNFGSKTELIVELPKKQWEKLQAKVISGDIYADLLYASSASLKTSSGHIKVSKLEANDASLESSSGNITVEQFTAEKVKTKASSGNTKLLNGKGGVEVKSSSGNIRLEMNEIERDIKLKGSSGNIELIAEAQPANADLKLKTSSGRVIVDWQGIDNQSMKNDSFEGRIGDGSIKIEAATSSGNIRLLK